MATVALSGIITPTNVVTATSTTTLTNKTLTGAVMNGTLGATTPSTVVATTVKASTTMGVGGATPSASGSGITFPATQSASTDANTLDDYEEGTWTGTLTGGTTNPTVTYTERTGRYVKVGGLVYINGEISGSTTGGSGQMQITGLPFTSLAAQPPWYASTLGVVNTTGGTTPTIAMVTASGTLIGMWAGSTATNWGSTTLVDWYFSAVYPAS
jgi:hypothetical protein